MANPLKTLRISTASAGPQRGWLAAGLRRLPVALGRGGIKSDKREGDGGTPRGRFRLTRVWWRADKGLRPRTRLPVQRIRPEHGWCDDPAHARYNRPIRLPASCRHERMHRADSVYDLVIELDHNSRPRMRGRGSAIFLHVAQPDFAPTAGCVALRRADLHRLLAAVGPETKVVIGRTGQLATRHGRLI